MVFFFFQYQSLSILDLPNETLTKILNYLCVEDYMNMENVCVRMRKLTGSRDAAQWRLVSFSHCYVSEEILKKLLDNGKLSHLGFFYDQK